MICLTNTENRPYIFQGHFALGAEEALEMKAEAFKAACDEHPALRDLCERRVFDLSKPGVPGLLAKVLG